tara:strand:+ start:8919 stop:9173 length:255 start_codon:yes stop_codon:yes gene_type:complete
MSKQEAVMRKISDTEVALESPQDVESAFAFCRKHGGAEAVFFVEGYPPKGRCDCFNPPKEFLKRMKKIVSYQADMHVRVGVCRT